MATGAISVPDDVRKATLDQRYAEASEGNTRLSKSAFLRLETVNRPTVEFWQKVL